MAKFEIFQKKNSYYWRLKADNGETVATSEVYDTKEGVLQGIASFKSNVNKQTADPLQASKDTLATYKNDFERLAQR